MLYLCYKLLWRRGVTLRAPVGLPCASGVTGRTPNTWVGCGPCDRPVSDEIRIRRGWSRAERSQGPHPTRSVIFT